MGPGEYLRWMRWTLRNPLKSVPVIVLVGVFVYFVNPRLSEFGKCDFGLLLNYFQGKKCTNIPDKQAIIAPPIQSGNSDNNTSENSVISTIKSTPTDKYATIKETNAENSGEILSSGKNSSPVAVNDRIEFPQQSVFSFDILKNDNDPDDDNIRIKKINGVLVNFGSKIALKSGAKITLNNGGSLSYYENNLAPMLCGQQERNEKFSYVISDGNNGTSTADVEIRILAPDSLSQKYVFSRFSKIDFLGSDISEFGEPVQDEFECESKCGATYGCNAYTYKVDENLCYFKNNIGLPLADEKAISGMTVETDDIAMKGIPKIKILGKKVGNYDFNGPYLITRRTYSSDLFSCLNLCARMSGGCSAFSYYKTGEESICWWIKHEWAATGTTNPDNPGTMSVRMFTDGEEMKGNVGKYSVCK